VSGGDPIKTGLQAFWYSIRTAILPFIFLFNTDILLIGVDTVLHGIWVFVYATIAILLLTAVLQGYFIIRSKLWETIILLMVSVALFRPGFFNDALFPPYHPADMGTVEEAIAPLEDNAELMLKIRTEDKLGEPIEHYMMLPLGKKTKSGAVRLHRLGIALHHEDDALLVDDVEFMSAAEKAGLRMDDQILEVGVPQPQPPRQWPYIPAFMLLGLVVYTQMKRSKTQND